MEALSALLSLGEGNPSVPNGLTSQRAVMWSFDVSFDVRLHKPLNNLRSAQWFETIRRSCDVPVRLCFFVHRKAFCWQTSDTLVKLGELDTWCVVLLCWRAMYLTNEHESTAISAFLEIVARRENCITICVVWCFLLLRNVFENSTHTQTFRCNALSCFLHLSLIH